MLFIQIKIGETNYVKQKICYNPSISNVDKMPLFAQLIVLSFISGGVILLQIQIDDKLIKKNKIKSTNNKGIESLPQILFV